MLEPNDLGKLENHIKGSGESPEIQVIPTSA